jgi:energy-coupling factor transporter ATP-binding protein EcfA2
MREAAEREAWARLSEASRRRGDRKLSLSMGVELELSRGCTVVAGRNGAGKSRLLTAAEVELADKGILIQLHQLCERIRAVHASRNDIPEMEEETGPLTLNADVVSHVRRIVGREYDDIQWFALDLAPSDEDDGTFLWASDQSLVPHFRATYKGLEYSTLDMGLGELSVHVLFWVLEQYRDVPGVTLLLDEPDAYLPPIGSERILARLQDVCLRRNWDLVVSTHSEEMIRTACANNGLLLLRRGDRSVIESARSWVDGSEIAAELLSEPPVDLVLFCEDESAAALARSLLRAGAEDRGRSVTVVWNNGHGYLTALSQHLPRYPRMKVKFGLVFDGDQRGHGGKSDQSSGWQSIFLPTYQDPDDLFKSLAPDSGRLAAHLQINEAVVTAWLDSLEGSDKHDWVNGLCDKHGVRMTVLDALADLWVADHPDECEIFNADVAAGRQA